MKNRILVLLAFTSALVATTACSTASPGPARTIGGHLLIVGGGPIPPEVIRRFVELAGGSGKARIVVFPMASGDSDAGIEMTADLEKLGARAERIVLDHAQADTDEAAKRLDGVTGIWFGG